MEAGSVNDYRRILWGIIIALVFGAYVFSFSVLMVVNNRLSDLNDSVVGLVDKVDIRLSIVEKEVNNNRFKIGHIQQKLDIALPSLD